MLTRLYKHWNRSKNNYKFKFKKDFTSNLYDSDFIKTVSPNVVQTFELLLECDYWM